MGCVWMQYEGLEAESKAVALAQGMAEAAFTQKIFPAGDGELPETRCVPQGTIITVFPLKPGQKKRWP